MGKVFLSVVLSFLLFAESFLPQMECSQLCKLPALMDHFKKHRSENPSISFMEFLRLHYDDTTHHEEDHQAHHDLPLSRGHQHQSHPSCFHSMALTMPVVYTLTSITPGQEIVVSKYIEPSTSSFLSSIWQPPRA